ncbi:Flocculation protein FLO11 [Lasiodiplodia hormozganensis]|uniref:Flocculation protein FLO11 n=1 Tax=Lasiodiplodia hormozganensis TaxID=869390 RepID=A0AA40CGH9_9PEZI|nr:Flocculation protein FLO11 [Lasiodiplodia hormozganensis]
MSSQPTSDSYSSSPPSTPRATRPASHTTTAPGGPTIRIVEDPGSPVYGKSPYSSEPSQILSPAAAQGSRQDGLASPVSDAGRSASPGADSQRGSFVQRMAARYEGLGPKASASQPRQSSASYRMSTSTTTSTAETLNTLAAPSSPSYNNRFSQGTTPPTSPLPSFSDRKHDSIGSLGLLTETEEKPPVAPVAPTVRAVIPSSSTTGETSFIPSQETTRLSEDYSNDTTETSFENSDASTPTLTYHHKDSDNQQSFWASASGSASDDRPPTRGSNYVRHGSDSDEPERPPTRGSNSVRSLSSTHTVNRRPSRANLREASDQSFSSGEPSGRPRSATSPLGTSHENRSIEDNSVIHYPTSSGEEWSHRFFAPPPPMPEPESPPRRYKWSPPLSTIESVSEPRTGSVASTMALSGMTRSNRRQTMGSYGSSDPWTSSEHRSSESRPDVPSTPSEFSVWPRPVFAGSRTGTGQLESRHSEEGNDTVGELHPQPLRLQRSGLFRRSSNGNLSNDGRPDTAASDRSSYTSFFANSIPQWARLYYRRSERVSLATDSSSSPSNSPLPSRSATMHSGTSRSPTEANFPIHPIWSPRRRPHHRDNSGSYSGHLSLGSNIMPYDSQDSISAAPPQRKPSQQPQGASGRTRADTAGTRSVPPTAGGRESFTPRLRRNRKSITLSVWTAPSMDQALGAPANKYIVLFALGFVLPLCWFIAAVLPLPMRPNDEFERLENEKAMIEKYHGGTSKGKERATELQPTSAPSTAAGGGVLMMGNETNIEGGLGLDLRNKTQLHQRDWAQEERLWQKAKWWRRVNRVMSFVGLCVIAAVVALAVVYTR